MPVASLLLVAALSHQGSEPKNLAEYVKAHPQEAGLTVDAERVRPGKKGVGLARFERKRVKVGGLYAIVPIETAQFDDRLVQPPNLYDGLPREAKLLYLVSTLTKAQLSKAAGTGIGAADLRGDARALFLSILPKRVQWSQYRLEKNGGYGKELSKGELDGAGLLGVRIRLERQLELELPLESEPNSYTFHSAREEVGKPGDAIYHRDNEDEYTQTESFGVSLRKTVPNLPKKGDLDTSGLNANVALPAGVTVGWALELAGRTSGREILTDVRVRDRKLGVPAGAVRAGDLLDAVAYAVGGTYRRIGGAFMLVSDVVGSGVRKLRMTLWEQDLQYALRMKEDEWRRGLAASGALDGIGYDASSGLAPSESMQEEMANRKPADHDKWTPTSEYPKEIRAFIDRINVRYAHQRVATDRARANWSLQYRFVTADGKAFEAERSGLGAKFQFDRSDAAESPEPSTPRGTLTPERGAGLALIAQNPNEARSAVTLARRYGFGELWLDADRVETLQAALDTGFPVRLVVRPWSAPAGTLPSALDRNVLGDDGTGAAARVDRSEATVRAARGPVRSGWERDPIRKSSVRLLSPRSPAWPARRATILALVATPGIKGVVLLETQPAGYEPTGPGRRSGIERDELLETLKMGYVETARLDFARRHGIDPIDLSSRGLMLSVDLRTPFFLDDALRGIPSVYDGTQTPLPIMEMLPDEWAKVRAAENAKAMEGLFAEIGAVPILVEPRATTSLDRTDGPLVPWTAGTPLPTMGNGANFTPGTRMLLDVPANGIDDRFRSFGNSLGMLREDRKFPSGLLNFGLGTLAAKDWEAAIGRWLTPVSSKANP